MATWNWRRCEKSMFYSRASMVTRLDKRKEAFNKAYVDPVDFVLVQAIPGDFGVTVMRWQVMDFGDNYGAEELVSQEASLILKWTERIISEVGNETEETWKRAKPRLLDDLDVDAERRDQLLSAIERFVFESPEVGTSFQQQKIPQNAEALRGVLFHFGVGPC